MKNYASTEYPPLPSQSLFVIQIYVTKSQYDVYIFRIICYSYRGQGAMPFL